MDFYIRQNSVLPTLRMELIEAGRHHFNKFHELLQNSPVPFTMTNKDTGVVKVAKAPAYIKAREGGGCVDQYLICFDWRKHETK